MLWLKIQSFNGYSQNVSWHYGVGQFFWVENESLKGLRFIISRSHMHSVEYLFLSSFLQNGLSEYVCRYKMKIALRNS